MNQKKIIYRPYPLKKKMKINNLEFDEIIISSHYEEEHISYMTDEKILEIAKQLDKRDNFIPKLQGKLPNGIEGQSFFGEPFYHEENNKEKAYRLVGYGEIGNSRLGVLHCHRRKNYEKKYNTK